MENYVEKEAWHTIQVVVRDILVENGTGLKKAANGTKLACKPALGDQ